MRHAAHMRLEAEFDIIATCDCHCLPKIPDKCRLRCVRLLAKMAHHEEAQVSAHLLGSVAHGTYVVCFHHNRDTIFWDIQTSPRPLKDGYYIISDLPGFGIELNRDYIHHYRV